MKPLNKFQHSLLIIVTIAISISLLIVFYWVGNTIPFASQYKIFEGIRNISSIIFGVCGAWLAITYPKAVSAIQKAESSETEKITEELEKASHDVDILLGFVKSMLISIVIISICLSLPFLKEIIVKCPWLLKYKSIILGNLFCLLGAITITQLYLLLSTLRNTYMALQDLKTITAKAITKSKQGLNREY